MWSVINVCRGHAPNDRPIRARRPYQLWAAIVEKVLRDVSRDLLRVQRRPDLGSAQCERADGVRLQTLHELLLKVLVRRRDRIKVVQRKTNPGGAKP